MKKISIMMAALLVAMTGCQKEPQVTPDGNDANAKHYVAVNIALPNNAATRADADPGHNDNFADGEAKEYQVNDVTLVFYTAEAGDYTFKQAVSANPSPWANNGTEDNITLSGNTGAIKVDHADISHVLVLVNAQGLTADYTGKTFSEFNVALTKTAEDIIGAAGDDFFMSNAPVFDETSKTFSVLVPITVYSTEAEARAHATECNVKVERAAAKVQVAFEDSYDATQYEGTAVFNNWALDVTNKSFFPVHKYEDYSGAATWWASADAFVNAGIFSSLSKRTYFSVDPNYSESYDAANFNYLTAGDVTLTESNVAYCLENTFTTGNMNQNQTTRVVLKAEFTPDGFTAGDTWYMVGSAKTAYTETALLTLLSEKAGVTVAAGDLEFDAKSALVYTGKTYEAAEASVGNVYKYTNGVCYYPVLIRHFIATEHGHTGESAFWTSYETGYKPCDLGRYGVVRNNWYKLTVNSVSEPGVPVMPETPDTPDDEITRYCACTIDILAWNVRNQGVDL